MMGGDPTLVKQFGVRNKYWTRVRDSEEEKIQVVLAATAQQIQEHYPRLEVFDPDPEWEAEHQGEIFREYDLEKDQAELAAL